MNLSNQHIRFGYKLLKLAIVLVSLYVIYIKVISRPDFSEMLNGFSSIINESQKKKLLIWVFLLMGANWILEAVKWKLLLLKITPVSFLRSMRSVLSGVTVSVFTPNRIGEFAGKILHLESEYRIKAAIASVIGSMNQLLITLVIGGVGLLFTLNQTITDNHFLINIQMSLVGIGIVVVTFVYFRLAFLSRIGEWFNLSGKVKLYSSVFSLYPMKELLKLTFLSLLRYLIFTFQFYLLLKIFDIDLNYWDAMRVISVVYLVMAVVPSIALSELTIRGSVALYFISSLTGNTGGIIAATSLLWFINLIVPAFLGALSAFYFKFYR